MLKVEHLVRTYPGVNGRPAVRAVDDVSFEVGRGDFFTLLGPSGCGKSTTLQCLAGLDTPDAGSIDIAGETVFCARRRIAVPANRRNLGMIFQSYAIWPHMTVFENVAFPLRQRQNKLSSAEVQTRVMRALEMAKLTEFAARPSPHLSGGQQQRVALARALVHEPALLLLDEPLSNLDAKLREAMRVELTQLVKALGITTVFVTHDQVEAMAMSDQVALLRDGKIVQQAAPRDIFLRPTNAFTADFMGRSNLVPGIVRLRESGEKAIVSTPLGDVHCDAAPDHRPGMRILVVIRPQAIVVTAGDPPPSAAHNTFAAVVSRTQFLGEAIEVEARVNDYTLRVMLPPFAQIEPAQRIALHIPRERCVVVPLDNLPTTPDGAPEVAVPAADARPAPPAAADSSTAPAA